MGPLIIRIGPWGYMYPKPLRVTPGVAQSAGYIVIYSICEFRFFKDWMVLDGFNKVIVVDVWMLFG